MPEQSLYHAHPAMFRNKPVGFVLACLLVPVFGIGLLILLIWWLRAMGTTLTVTEERITLRQGILSKHINEVYHTDVRNVRVSQTLFQRMFNVGAIGIATAGHSDIEIAVGGMPDPGKIKALIDTYRRRM